MNSIWNTVRLSHNFKGKDGTLLMCANMDSKILMPLLKYKYPPKNMNDA